MMPASGEQSVNSGADAQVQSRWFGECCVYGSIDEAGDAKRRRGRRDGAAANTRGEQWKPPDASTEAMGLNSRGRSWTAPARRRVSARLPQRHDWRQGDRVWPRSAPPAARRCCGSTIRGMAPAAASSRTARSAIWAEDALTAARPVDRGAGHSGWVVDGRLARFAHGTAAAGADRRHRRHRRRAGLHRTPDVGLDDVRGARPDRCARGCCGFPASMANRRRSPAR